MPRRKRPENMPSEKVLDRAKDTVSERLKASRKVVNKMKGKWAIWERMYKSEQLYQRRTGESNLVLPKADYIVETISAKVVNTIFSVADWLTMKHHKIPPEELALRQKWFIYIMNRKANFYTTALEAFKGAPIKGTSVYKCYNRNLWPYSDYIKLENFLPDPLCNKPGDIQEMRYCMHQFRRDLNQLKQFVNAYTKESLYFNLDILQEKAELMKQHQVKVEGADVSVEDKIMPIFDIIEYHGEFEHQQGSYEDYIITGTLSDKDDEKLDTVIRCEPARLKKRDPYTGQTKTLKPFVAAIYSVNPGEFYGKSAIQPVESLINEQTDLHNLYMDNHKRIVNGITKVLNRSNLTRDDLPQVPGALWFLDAMEDVEFEQHPEVNLLAYKAIHELLDTEQEKGTGVTSYNLGVSRTKRQTLGEVQSMLSEAGDRFQTFIQMADRLTLRPTGQLIYELLRQSLKIWADEEMTFPFEGQQIRVTTEDLAEDMEVSFAATTVESEFSKYAKQQTFPQFLQTLFQIAGPRVNIDYIVKELGELFNYKNPERFLYPSESVPIAALHPDVQQHAMEVLQMLKQQEGTAGGNGQAQTPQFPQLTPPGV